MSLVASLLGRLSIKQSGSRLLQPFVRATLVAGGLNHTTAYSTASTQTTKPANPVSPSITSATRKTTKHIFARKTFLVDYYTHLNRTNEIVLYVHHNNLVKTENKKFRADLAKHDAKLTLIRNSIYNVFLKSENEEDPADDKTSKKNKNVVHPISPLLNGPTAIITIPKCDPKSVESILKILKAANEKLILIGAKVEQQVFNVDDINKFKDLPTKEQLHSQLLGTLTLLSGSGLVQTLEAPSKLLYLTGKELVKMNEPKDE